MELTCRPAKTEEFEAVRAFYCEMTSRMEEYEYHPKWVMGVYPSDDYLREACENGQAYLACIEDRILGAMVVNQSLNEGYENAAWVTAAKPDEVCGIHTLAVMPDALHRGVGRFLVENAIRVALQKGCRAIRLDVLSGNLPACRLYESAGFQFVERRSLYYEDTGFCDFDLYEKKVSRQ